MSSNDLFLKNIARQVDLERSRKCWKPKCKKDHTFEIRIVRGNMGKEIRACATHFVQALQDDFLPVLHSWIKEGHRDKKTK